jgi:hypothetical protein
VVPSCLALLTMTRFAQPKSFCGAALVALLAAALSIAAAGRAAAENSQAPAPPVAAAPTIPPQAPPGNSPGFLHQLKVWWDQSIAVFDAKIKDTRGTVDDLNKKSSDAAKDAATATQGAMKGAVDATKDAAAATQGAMKNALDATKDAAAVIVRLPNTRVVELHARCETAPNGAPDCATAATNACRGKGFNGGQPLDVRTAEKCDTTPAFQAGQSPGKGECPIESWITRAVCQ